MAPHLHLLSLGAPLLLTETGEQIRFDTRKQLALLIRLAFEGSRTLSREYLTELLWPSVPGARARHSLAQAAAAVREKVGREHILLDRFRIELSREAIDVDMERLDAGIAQIRGQFLEGFEVPKTPGFEHWKDSWRARLLPKIRDCLVTQMDAARRVGDFATLEGRAHALLQVEPLSEDAVRGMMEARAWFGDRTGALQEYRRLEARLARKFSAVPTPALKRMADLLRDGRRVWPSPPLARLVSERQDRRIEAEPLIGREREFAQLQDAWREVRRGQPRLAVLLGDPGVGKTTLTNALASTCQMEGAAIARAQAYDAERELPFALLAELIRQLTLQGTIAGADPEALGELTRISPDVRTSFAGVPKPADWSAEVIQLRLADALLKVVEAATEVRPLVLVVDDLHAADNASVAILHMLARKLRRRPLFLILTATPTELRAASAANALASDTNIQVSKTLVLQALTLEAAERLIGVLVANAGARLSEFPVTRILHAANGNPLAIQLLTREWLVHGSSSLLSDLESLDTQPAANIGIPFAIGAVFDRQILRLNARTRAALDLAAILGRRLADLPLYEVVDLSPSVAGEALSRLKEEGLLREMHGELEFRNELIRAQAYYAVATPARQHMHLRVAEVLQSRTEEPSGRRQLEVAWHFLRGSDPSRAISPALDGAQAAINSAALFEAEQILNGLLCTHCVGGALRRLLILLASALVGQSKAQAATQVLKQLSQDPELSHHDRALVARMRATVQYLLNEELGSNYCAAADKALSEALETGDLELIGTALFECARSGVNAGSEARVAETKRRAQLAIAQQEGELPPIYHYAKAYCDFFFFDLAEAGVGLRKTIRILNARRDPIGLSLAYTGYGICKDGLCEFDLACQAFNKAYHLSRRIGDDFRAAINASNLCVAKLHHGDFPSAIRFGEHAASIAAGTINPRSVTIYLNLAAALLMAGQRDAAREALSEAQRVSKSERSWVASMEYALGSASFALESGEVPLALRLTEAAERLAWGKERAVPNAGLFDKLRIFRAAHVGDRNVARDLALQCQSKYRNRHPFYYLGITACLAWLDNLSGRRHREETVAGLKVLSERTATGLRAILTAQGFIPELRQQLRPKRTRAHALQH